ncbi:MAG TPA: tetratricopeptide repeat protein [Gemmatimonadales bacterium]|nr:tetratricopeptide repeat protein [Gemmatimonadales bacterium]
MPDLPSGTVTFLFTDIEGSTALWERDRSAMAAAVERHIALLDAAIQAHEGIHFKTVGDAVQAAFPTAPQALAAALDAQRALLAEDWGEFGPLTVRMALHAGEAEPDTRGDYLAAPLNRLSRLLAAGHGGQILLSQAVQQLSRGALPAGTELLNLGDHRLRDLLEPERVFQLVHPGLPADFPPLRSLEGRPNNLPHQPTPLLGRERELGEVADLLRREDVHVVTLTGPAGVGKTRLALQAAADLLEVFPDGAFFVELAPLADPALVPSTVASALGVREEVGQPLIKTLTAFLRDRQVLLALDNFEHLLPAAPVVSDLLRACPGVKILATSRAPLHLRGEREYPVPALALPDPSQPEPVAQLIQYEAIRLFVERAQAAKPAFALTDENAAAVTEICCRLDGLPLAIELAAARVKLLPPQALLDRLGERLKVLTGGARDAPARQRTLRDAIAWSHDLLSEHDQTLFRRLAVFAGGCTLEAVEAVANAAGDLDTLEGMTSLVDESLLREIEGPDDEPRFAMLETIREYGLERLDVSGESETVQERHATYFASVAEALRPHLYGPDQGRTIGHLEAEQGNIRTALAWAVEQADAATGLRLAANLRKFWLLRSQLTEGRNWLEQTLAMPGDGPTSTRIDALYGVGSFARLQGDYPQAIAYGDEGLALARGIGDEIHTARLLYLLGMIAHYKGNRDRAKSFYEEALGLARGAPDAHLEAMLLTNLGDVVVAQDDPLAAQGHYGAALAIWRQRRDDWGIGIALLNLGHLAQRSGDAQRAGGLYGEGLTMSVELGDQAMIADYLNAIGRLAAALGQWSSATCLLSAATALYHSLGIEQFPDHRGEHEHAVAAARAGLGDEAFTAAWDAGQALLPEQAIAEAQAVTAAQESATARQPS